jgi:hypothetical protein
MRTVVIPDVHQRVSMVEKILSRESSAQEFVFLGDWFDAWESDPEAASFEKTCEFFRALLTSHPLSDRFVFLVGNHDLPYIYHNSGGSNASVKGGERYSCSGFTKSKARKFRKSFYENSLRDDLFVRKLKILHQTQGVTLSHAGVDGRIVRDSGSVENLVRVTAPSVWMNFRNFSFPGNELLSGCGRSRGGPDPVGGPLWLDWNSEFRPTVEVGKQLVGHTTVREPSCIGMGTPSESWNLDTGKDYAVVLGGVVSTRQI